MFLNWRFRRRRIIFIVHWRLDLLFETSRFCRYVGRFHVKKIQKIREAQVFPRDVLAVQSVFEPVLLFCRDVPTHVSHFLFTRFREQFSSRGRDRTRTNCLLPTHEESWTVPMMCTRDGICFIAFLLRALNGD